MIEIGQYQTLKVCDIQPQGPYLSDPESEDSERVLLPRRFAPEDTEIGDELKVFVYLDSDDRTIATTQTPRVALHQAANLRVKEVNRIGAFLDWGLPKDLFVPFAEQTRRLEAGTDCIVYVTKDNTGRLIGTTQLNKHIKDEVKANWPGAAVPLSQGDRVKLLITNRTDIGYKAIVNDEYWGVLHESQVHKAIRTGQRCEGYVRRIRDDLRLDISLEPLGHTRADPLAKKILEKLNESDGALSLGDHSPADIIELHFSCSKRAFKMAIGKLFKQKQIVITEQGICLPDHPNAANAKERQHTSPQKTVRKKAPHKSNSVNQQNRKAEQKKKNQSKAGNSTGAKKVYRNPKAKKESTLSLKK